MEWYLVIYLLSVEDLRVIEFKTQQSCEEYLIAYKNKIMQDKDVKKVQCETDPGFHKISPSNKQNIKT